MTLLQVVGIVAQQFGQHRTKDPTLMQLARLLADATQLPDGTSQRQQHVRLTELLNERYPQTSITLKGVSKWFERGSIPSAWLLRIAQLPKKPLNLAHYA